MKYVLEDDGMIEAVHGITEQGPRETMEESKHVRAEPAGKRARLLASSNLGQATGKEEIDLKAYFRNCAVAKPSRPSWPMYGVCRIGYSSSGNWKQSRSIFRIPGPIYTCSLLPP